MKTQNNVNYRKPRHRCIKTLTPVSTSSYTKIHYWVLFSPSSVELNIDQWHKLKVRIDSFTLVLKKLSLNSKVLAWILVIRTPNKVLPLLSPSTVFSYFSPLNHNHGTLSTPLNAEIS
jgi:hypothetical protein